MKRTLPAMRRPYGLLGVMVLAAWLGTAWNSVPEAGSASESSSGMTPFAVGERLVYHVEWDPPLWFFLLPTMEAGEATLNLTNDTESRIGKEIKIIFTARSSGILTRLARINIDDHYEFITNPDTFCTSSVTKRIREGKRMRDIDVQYFPERRILHMREVDVSTSTPRVITDKDFEDIPPCVRDLFSALYSVRKKELAAGSTFRLLVGDNDKVKEVEARVEKGERILTPMGPFNTWRINTVAVLGGLFKSGGQFRIWLTADERKMPVKFEVKVKLGKVTGSLKELTF